MVSQGDFEYTGGRSVALFRLMYNWCSGGGERIGRAAACAFPDGCPPRRQCDVNVRIMRGTDATSETIQTIKLGQKRVTSSTTESPARSIQLSLYMSHGGARENRHQGRLLFCRYISHKPPSNR